MRTIKECEKLKAHLLGVRTKREAAWHDLSRWIAGTRGVFNTGEREDPYETKDITLFRAITAQALLKGTSGMTSGMTPRNVSWFEPSFADPQMEEITGARQWLDQLDQKIKDCLSAGGFYQAIQQFNCDLLWSGCALLYSEKGSSVPLRFDCIQVGSFCVGMDAENRLNTVLRQLRITPTQMAEYFGKENLSEATKKLLDTEPFAERIVWHLTEKGNSSRGGINNRDFTVDSYYFEDGGKDFLRKSGYYEMPFFFAVWNEGATPYGTGPGDECLADAKQIDQMERRKLEGLGKIVNPPVAAPISMKDQVDLSPGAVNWVAGQEQIRPIIDLQPYAGSLKYLQEEINIVAQRIQNGLMASIFMSIPLDQRPANMSATEFLERKREAMQQLGPVISAYEPNVLHPLLMRVAQCLDRENLTPVVPQELAQYPIFMKMEFISPMANAMRQTSAEAARAILQDVAQIAQTTSQTAIFDKIDFDQAVDELSKGVGAPASIIRSDADVEAIRQQRQQEQQQQEQMAQMQQTMNMTQQAADTLQKTSGGMVDTGI